MTTCTSMPAGAATLDLGTWRPAPSDRPRSGRSRNSCLDAGFGHDFEKPPPVHELRPEVAAQVELGGDRVTRRGVVAAQLEQVSVRYDPPARPVRILAGVCARTRSSAGRRRVDVASRDS